MVAKRTVKLLIQWLSFLLGLSLPFRPPPSHNDALLQPTKQTISYVALGSLAHFEEETTWLRLVPNIWKRRKYIYFITGDPSGGGLGASQFEWEFMSVK